MVAILLCLMLWKVEGIKNCLMLFKPKLFVPVTCEKEQGDPNDQLF